MIPKVFISYSWTNQAHQEQVKEWADRLIDGGVNVILDIYDLKEGHDKFAFMERMVNDPEVTHVLVVSDMEYAEKANARQKGVGTESQIISKEVYSKVDQSKFIPLVCEFSGDGSPCLPVFLAARIWIDFSTPEAVNGNWERLVRLLYGKPLHQKPKLGKAPAYILEDGKLPSMPAQMKFNDLKQAIIQGKPRLRMYRSDFIDSCIVYADALRTRQPPKHEKMADKILEDCGNLVVIRELVVDWVLLEASVPSDGFSESLIDFLERLVELKARPKEVDRWNDEWFEGHGIFAYETFLYIVAGLLKSGAYRDLHNIYTSHYMIPETERYGESRFRKFDAFLGFSRILNDVLATDGREFYSPAAELIKRQSNRRDIPFSELIQADLLSLLMAFVTPDVEWHPQLMYYAESAKGFPFFVKAAQHKNFRKLIEITGVADASALKDAVLKGHERLGVDNWRRMRRNFSSPLNMENWDTLK
ncbi:MAG: SEFIR domain-containing protein [Prosthecobacter sp.]